MEDFYLWRYESKCVNLCRNRTVGRTLFDTQDCGKCDFPPLGKWGSDVDFDLIFDRNKAMALLLLKQRTSFFSQVYPVHLRAAFGCATTISLNCNTSTTDLRTLPHLANRGLLVTFNQTLSVTLLCRERSIIFRCSVCWSTYTWTLIWGKLSVFVGKLCESQIFLNCEICSLL